MTGNVVIIHYWFNRVGCMKNIQLLKLKSLNTPGFYKLKIVLKIKLITADVPKETY